MGPMKWLLAALVVLSTAGAVRRGVSDFADGKQQQDLLMQTWDEALDGSAADAKASVTPVTRVVNLLKDMQATIKKEMDEDEELYSKLQCWCSSNDYEKGMEISAAEAKIADLKSTIEALTAKSTELKESLKMLEAQIAEDKEALANAQAIADKEAKEFHGKELDLIQAIENLKAAIMVIQKHHGAALPQIPFALLQGPWDASHESDLERTFDSFLGQNGFDGRASQRASPATFLRQEEPAPKAASALQSWPTTEVAVLRRALKSASTFMQSHQGSQDLTGYAPQSGEILGILKQLKDQMEGDLSESSKAELARAAEFQALRTAKETEIEAAEAEAESKEDLLATTDMDAANAAETLEQTEAGLSEAQKFMINLKKTCSGADENFELRKKERLGELKAISETITILTADEARDKMQGTYSFSQLSSVQGRRAKGQRQRAASLLRAAAAKSGNPELSILASSVELDAFARVKQAIEDMVSMLKQEQADEVKHKDWCTGELHETEMGSNKAATKKSALDVKVEDLTQTAARLKEEVQQAHAEIARLQSELQGASENRQAANLDFQTTVADQRATMQVLEKALDKLATFYDKEALLVQTAGKGKAKVNATLVAHQAPPVAQAEYKPNAGASVVMSMIEKLIFEAKELEAEAVKGEAAAQAQYETLVADTNASVKGLYREIATKTEQKAEADAALQQAQSDLKDVEGEIERLAKYNTDIHTSCDFVLKNFDIRQQARLEEIEALQQAKQILSGANLNA